MRKVYKVFAFLGLTLSTALPVLAQETSVGAVAILIDKIDKIVKAAQAILLAASVLVFMYSGYLHMTAQGEPERERKAKKVLTGGLIGVALVVLAEAIKTAIVSILR